MTRVVKTVDIAPGIYAKTAKGREEINGRVYGLSAKERRILILVDARRSVDELARIAGMQGEASWVLLAGLLKAEFIELQGLEGMPVHPRFSGAPDLSIAPGASTRLLPGEPVVIDEALVAAKRILAESTDVHLGLLGVEIRRRVETAHDLEAIKACIAKWHMAMRESPSGRQYVDEQLHRLQLIMA